MRSLVPLERDEFCEISKGNQIGVKGSVQRIVKNLKGKKQSEIEK
jgi:hypothetical protein